jgi:ribonuclease P protein component
MTARFCFPPSLRLRKRADFLRLSHEGSKVHQSHFILICRHNPDGLKRFGVTVSRKVGNAVIRNRVKRLVREVCRHSLSVPPADYSIIARKGAGTLGVHAVRVELEKAFRQVPNVQ